MTLGRGYTEEMDTSVPEDRRILSPLVSFSFLTDFQQKSEEPQTDEPFVSRRSAGKRGSMKRNSRLGRPTPGRWARGLALCLALTLSPGLAQADPGDQTSLPDGFPAELAVPFATPLVFLTGSAQIVGDDGRPRPHARTCEFSRNDTADATRLMEHYLAHFASEGWDGSLTEQGEERSGSFEHEGVKATVRLRPRAGGVLAFTMRVQVLLER